MLDSRAPPAQIAEEERERDEATESEIARLMLEARIWRVANSAQWVAWGIVQAKIPQMRPLPPAQTTLDSDPLSPEMAALAQDALDKRPEEGGDETEEEEFDYLGYAQERAMFFWGDVVQLGLVGREELPEGLEGRIKVVEYWGLSGLGGGGRGVVDAVCRVGGRGGRGWVSIGMGGFLSLGESLRRDRGRAADLCTT